MTRSIKILSIPVLMMGMILSFALLSQNTAVPGPNIAASIGASQTEYVEPHVSIRHPECQTDRQKAQADPSLIQWWDANCKTDTQYGEGESFMGQFGAATFVGALVIVGGIGIFVVKTIMRVKGPLDEYSTRRNGVPPTKR